MLYTEYELKETFGCDDLPDLSSESNCRHIKIGTTACYSQMSWPITVYKLDIV